MRVLKTRMNKKTIIPATGTLLILLTILLYFTGSAIGLVTNPFFTPKLGENQELAQTVNPNQNAPKLSWETPTKDITTTEITNTINQEITQLQTLTPNTSLTITNPNTGQTLYELQTNTPMPVASSTKLLTAIATLQELTPQYRFKTNTSVDENHNLYLKSNGDILLNPETTNTENTTSYAGLKTLADETTKALKKLKITETNLYIDDTHFGTEDTLNSWKTQQVEEHVGKIVPLAVNKGQIKEEKYDPNPTQTVANIFKNHLINNGIQIRETKTNTKLPKYSKELAHVYSDKLENIIKYTLKNSDNPLSETLTRAAAIHAGYPNTFKGTSQFTKNTLKNLNLDTQNLILEDSSGLSVNNQITTKLLVSALEKTTINNTQLFSIINSLPQGATDGTLKDRFKETGNKIQAKTGTLPQTSSLTGIIYTESKNTLIFSINTTGFDKNKLWHVRTITDTLVTNLQKL